MRKKVFSFVVLFMVASLSVMVAHALSQEKPKIAPLCRQCHTPEKFGVNTLFGTMGGAMDIAEAIQVQVGPAVWIVKYDKNTMVAGADSIEAIKKDKEISVSFMERDKVLYATTVKVKPPAKVPPEKVMNVEELARLVELGPGKGNFVLVDSRPCPRYHEGYIPGAICIYDAEFDKHIDNLPKEKDKLLIFYCAGVT